MADTVHPLLMWHILLVLDFKLSYKFYIISMLQYFDGH